MQNDVAGKQKARKRRDLLGPSGHAHPRAARARSQFVRASESARAHALAFFSAQSDARSSSSSSRCQPRAPHAARRLTRGRPQDLYDSAGPDARQTAREKPEPASFAAAVALEVMARWESNSDRYFM